jgi:hypothetical protein
MKFIRPSGAVYEVQRWNAFQRKVNALVFSQNRNPERTFEITICWHSGKAFDLSFYGWDGSTGFSLDIHVSDALRSLSEAWTEIRQAESIIEETEEDPPCHAKLWGYGSEQVVDLLAVGA